MISYKEDKLVHSTDILNYLWQGKITEAMGYLQGIKAKNQPSKEMLITYLTKNKNTIINYKKRQENGKIIGSGRTEKANDTFVAKRQNGVASAIQWNVLDKKWLTINYLDYCKYYCNVIVTASIYWHKVSKKFATKQWRLSN